MCVSLAFFFRALFLRILLVVQQLFQRAHEYANLANRARAIASDVLLACDDFDLTPKELNKISAKKGTPSVAVFSS